MNSFRSLIQVFFAALLVALALPTYASGGDDDDDGPTKIFSLNMAPPSLAAGASATLMATFKNETPSGTAAIKSLKLFAPGGLTITAVATPPSGTATIAAGGGSVSVTNMSPVKKGQSFVLSLTVGAANGCTASTVTWDAKAWTGSSFNNNTFKLLTDARSSLTTAITAACSMVFVTQPPPSTLSGGLIGGPVKIQVSPIGVFSGKSITLGFASSPGGPPTFAAGTNVAAIDASGFATFPTLSISGPAGAYTLSATTGATGYPTATSASFNIAASDGVLDCQAHPNGGTDAFSDPSGPTKVSGNRGLNKDNSACKLVVYDLTIVNRTVSFVWDTVNQPNAAFAYSIDFAPEFVDPVTGLPKLTQLAWTQTAGIPNFVPGRACISPNLPAPYGTLNATIASGDTMFGVTAAVTLPAVPFPIVIGTERMTVTATGTSWTVVRGVGGTTPAAHLAGVSVMSTPFPLDASALQMSMCIQDETFVTLTPDKCTPINANASCVGVSSTIFDAGDGAVSRDL